MAEKRRYRTWCTGIEHCTITEAHSYHRPGRVVDVDFDWH
jgi:hypothetical protein